MRSLVVCFALFALTLSTSGAGLPQAQPPQQQAEPPFPVPAQSAGPARGAKKEKKAKKAPDKTSKKKDRQQIEKK